MVIAKSLLTPKGANDELQVRSYSFSEDNQKSPHLYQYQKSMAFGYKGDYWILDLKTNQLSQLGKGFDASSLMFAKISPDSKSVAFVYKNNIYVENIATHKISALTKMVQKNSSMVHLIGLMKKNFHVEMASVGVLIVSLLLTGK